MNEEELELYYQTRREYERKRALYFLAQKTCGLILVGITVLSAFCLGDATISIITMPLGIYLLFTRQKVMNF